jgi:nucleoside-diphosphate-sugar epimerase
VPLPGGGRAEVPFCYIGNLVHAVLLSIDCAGCRGRTFIIGDEVSYSLREIVIELGRALGLRPRIVSLPDAAFHLAAAANGLLAAIRHAAPLLDESRVRTLTTSVSYSTLAFQEATGYRPPYSLSDACERIARWYREPTVEARRP